MELLYVDPDDIYLHRGLIQGQFSPSYQPSFSDADIVQTYSVSALASVGLIRKLAGARSPLFSTQMYHRLGNQGATSLLAGLAVFMVPILFILERYGMKLKQKSRWRGFMLNAVTRTIEREMRRWAPVHLLSMSRASPVLRNNICLLCYLPTGGRITIT